MAEYVELKNLKREKYKKKAKRALSTLGEYAKKAGSTAKYAYGETKKAYVKNKPSLKKAYSIVGRATREMEGKRRDLFGESGVGSNPFGGSNKGGWGNNPFEDTTNKKRFKGMKMYNPWGKMRY